MFRAVPSAMLCALLLEGSVVLASAANLDKNRIAEYIRYAEGFNAGVRIEVDDPAPSPFPGLNQILVHLSTTRGKTDRVYYLTPDGGRLINGSVWQLDSSPFLETLSRLPKA